MYIYNPNNKLSSLFNILVVVSKTYLIISQQSKEMAWCFF